MISKNIEEVKNRISEIKFDEKFDLIIFIANGGIIPGIILNQKLKLPYEILFINYRDDKHLPKYDNPKLLKEINFDVVGKRILLIDDVSKTGSTFLLAKNILKEADIIKTFVINGNADYKLYNEECFKLPWLL